MRILRELVRAMIGLVIGASIYQALFVKVGVDRLWVLLVAGAVVLFGLYASRNLRLEIERELED